MSEIVTRFAPSPTGYLHLGHAYAAKQAFEFAKTRNGSCLLRIEDVDYTRCKPDYTKAILEDLDWLGFSWPEPVRIQSEHRTDYDTVVASLADRNLAYRCFKQRRDLPKGLYRGRPDPHEHKKLKAEKPFAWRLWMDNVQDILNEPFAYADTGMSDGFADIKLATIGDEILARKDIGTSYLVACAHDDAVQGITHVVRGNDMADFTAVQVILQCLMQWKTPIYHHHDVIMGEDGKKLSKRNKDTTIRSLRAQGLSPDEVMAMAKL